MATPSIDEWGLVRSDREETEESYFVSMTDIMVGLLFVFIIMLMAFGLMLKIAEENTDKTRTEMREVVRETRDEVSDMRDVDSLRAQMLMSIADELSKRGIDVTVRVESGVLQLPDEILFDHDDAQLTTQGIVAIGHLAEVLDEILPCYAVVPVEVESAACELDVPRDLRLEAVFIEGHTDTDGPPDHNWRLSTDRSINTFQALVDGSDIATRLLNDQEQYLFSVAGYGENRLLIEDELTPEDKRRNRRIDLRFVMNVSHEDALQRVEQRLEEVLELP